MLTASIAGAKGPRQAGLRCTCFALGLHVAGHGWVFHALLKQTEAGLLWALLGSTLFLSYLACFLSIPALLCKWLSQRVHARDPEPENILVLLPIALAVAWTAAEALRGMLFNGFDSLAAGYLFTAWPLRGWIPVVGVYGGSLLFYASACLAGAAWAARRDSVLARSFWVMAPLGLVLAVGAGLDTQQWVTSNASPLSFRLIQGGVRQEMKFHAIERERQVMSYFKETTAAPADLIITPETAFTVEWREVNPSVLSRVRDFSSATRSHIFLGMPHSDVGGTLKNSILQIAPGRTDVPRYDKSRLMPFGEYSPTGFGWFSLRMSVALKDQSPGSVGQPPFEVNKGGELIRVGTLICHEDLSQADARRWAGEVGLLINPGNLAWFEGTWALPQRLQVAQTRALEIGRPLLRTTNTGVTAHIDGKGRVVAQLPLNVGGVLSGVVLPTTGLTPFVRFGNLLVFGMAVVLLLLSALMVCVRSAHRKSP